MKTVLLQPDRSLSRTTVRRGFTLVELLVVIAIIGVLVGLLLPAVQAAREAARRMQCSNNLKQLGLACHNYIDAQKQFPWNSGCGSGDAAPDGDGGRHSPSGFPTDRWMQFSWLTMVLPYIEQQNIYNQVNWNSQYGLLNTTTFGNTNNNALANTVISTYLCPSSGHESIRQNQIPGNDWTGKAQAAGTDYVGNMGHVWAGWKDCGTVPDFAGPAIEPNLFVRGSASTPWASERWVQDGPVMNGVFRFHGSVKIGDIKDGTSNTICVFEDMHWKGGTNPRFDYGYTDDSAWMSPLAAINSMRNPMNMRNPAWFQSDGDNAPGDRRCHGWSSAHTGGAQAALCDGSVRFFSSSIDHITRYSLAARNDGFPISGDF